MLFGAVNMPETTRTKGPRMLKKLTLIAALTCAAMPAFASHWITVDGHPGSPQIMDIDTTSITWNGPIASFWERATFLNPRKLSPEDAEAAALVKIHARVDCAKKMQATTSMAKYSASGETIGGTLQGTGTFDDVVPDSVGESVMRAVCKMN